MGSRHESFYPEDMQPSSTGAYSRIITLQAFNRIKGLLDSSKGKVVLGGEMDETKKYFAPTIVKDVKGDDSLMSEYDSTISSLVVESLTTP